MFLADLFIIAKNWKEAKCSWNGLTKHNDNVIIFTNKKKWTFLVANGYMLQSRNTSKTCSLKKVRYKRPNILFNLHEISREGKATEAGKRLMVAYSSKNED